MKIKTSTPGRICLFGEHQDYLKLPVIAAAISKRVSIEGVRNSTRKISISLPDINSCEEFEITEKIPYIKERDYLRSSFNVLLRNGFTFSYGLECIVKGNIPVNTGTSSSSALIASWINLLALMSDQEKELSSFEIARYAYISEVEEFGEPGGMMDHYSTSIGGVIYLCTEPEIKIEKLNSVPGTFILGNSQEPKDTKNILARVKHGVLNIISKLRENYPEFSLNGITTESFYNYENVLTVDESELLYGTVINKTITEKAKELLSKKDPDRKEIGLLLNEHQEVLRDYLKISTSKIDRMINAALDAGAYGGKINGSGGGGCMFAYAPDNPEKVLRAVKLIAPDSHIVHFDEGTRVDYYGGDE
ncbi:MAG: galactokinase family protein [Bacteroidota bacterium]